MTPTDRFNQRCSHARPGRTPRWRPLLTAAAACAGTVALAATCACQRVDDTPNPADGDASTAADVVAEVSLDSAYFDLQVETKAEVQAEVQQEVAPPAKEQCGNDLDDDGDGYVDEEGCYPGPNVRPDGSWLDLGVVDIAQGKDPAPLRGFVAAAKDQGMVVAARHVGAGAAGQPAKYVWAEQLISPSGVQAISAGAWATSPNRAFVGEGASTVLVGMGPSVSVLEGTWKVGFTHANYTPYEWDGTTAAARLHLGVYSRPDVPSAQTAKLDLDVFCVGGSPMPCAELAKSPQWKVMLAKVTSIWAPAGVALGEVQLFDLDGDAGTKFKYVDNIGQGPATNELFSVYAATGKMRPKSTAATLILVAGLYDNGQVAAAGLSTLAGVPGWAGQRVSGLAVAIDPEQWKKAVALGPDSPYVGDVWGVVIAHEIGHFLGLWHTDEKTGAQHDIIDDTPECALDPKDNKDASTCPVQAKYLMFWAPTGTVVSAGQAKVVRHSPALR